MACASGQLYDSDDPTSSSENESLSSEEDESRPISQLVSQARAPSPVRSASDVPIPTHRSCTRSPSRCASRKVEKACDAIDWSFAYVAELTGGPKTGSPPWAGLVQTLTGIRALALDSKVQGDTMLPRLTAIVLSLVKHRILPLAKDRSYGKLLSKPEGKFRIRLLKLWPSLQSLLDILRGGYAETDELHDVSAEVLLSFARCALHYDNSTLVFDRGVTQRGSLPGSEPLSRQQILRCFDRFDISPEEVDHITFVDSDLDVCPSWVFGVPPQPMLFPNLRDLDLSMNRRLSWIPIRAATLCIQLVCGTDTVLDTAEFSGLPERIVLSVLHCDPWRRKSTSLIQACITVLLESAHGLDLSAHLPDHLAQTLSHSYLCEICSSTCLLGTRDWLDVCSFGHPKGRKIVWPDGSRGCIRMQGRLCSTCATMDCARLLKLRHPA